MIRIKKITNSFAFFLDNNRMVLFIWIILFASLVSYLNYINPGLLIYSHQRLELLKALTETVGQGEIPKFLSQVEHSYGFSFYLPYICYFFGVQNYSLFFLILHIVATWVLLVAFPIEIFLLTRNRITAFFSPVLLHIFVGESLYGIKTETLWSGGFTLILCAPIIYIYYKTNNWKNRLLIVIFVGLICSIANILRNENSFSTFMFLLIIMIITAIKDLITIKTKGSVLKYNNFALVILYSIILVFIYFFLYYLICSIIPYVIGIALGLPIIDNGGFVWHSILCGLIKWDDEYILNLVSNEYGIKKQYSSEYLNCCRLYFLNLLTDQPLFVISRYWSKFLFCIKEALGILFAGTLKLRTRGINVHVITIPTIIVVIVSSVLSFRTTYKEIIKKIIKKMIPWFVLWILVSSLGMIQGIIANGEYKYFIPGIVGIAALPMFVSLEIVNNFTNSIKKEGLNKDQISE